jgi:flagellar assembly factor FliW
MCTFTTSLDILSVYVWEIQTPVLESLTAHKRRQLLTIEEVPQNIEEWKAFFKAPIFFNWQAAFTEGHYSCHSWCGT